NLQYLPAKEPAASPCGVLDSDAIRSLLSDLRRHYDFIVLDAPPALDFADASIAAALADAVLFVVQWGKTPDFVAANGLDPLTKSGAPVVGAVITQVDLQRHAQYGYGDVAQYYPRRRFCPAFRFALAAVVVLGSVGVGVFLFRHPMTQF